MSARAKFQQPALTPLLLGIQGYLGCVSRLPAGTYSPLANTIWGTTLVSFFAIFTFSGWAAQVSLSSIISTAALLIVYAAPMSRVGTFAYLPSVNIESTIRSLSPRIIILLLFILSTYIILFGFVRFNPFSLFILGLLKALSWYFVIKTASLSSRRTL
jgi:hypothetical protein